MPAPEILYYDQGWSDYCGDASLAGCLESLGYRPGGLTDIDWIKQIAGAVHDGNDAPNVLTNIDELVHGLVTWCQQNNHHYTYEILHTTDDVYSHVMASHEVIIEVTESFLEKNQNYGHFQRIVRADPTKQAYALDDSFGREDGEGAGAAWLPMSEVNTAIANNPEASYAYGLAIWLESAPTVQQFTESSSDFSRFLSGSGDVWTCPSNQCVIQFGIKSFYQTLSLDGQSLPIPGLPVSNEQPQTINGQSVAFQKFERCYLVYDPQHVVDYPPGAGNVYLAHLDNPVLAHLFPGAPVPTASQPQPAAATPQPATATPAPALSDADKQKLTQADQNLQQAQQLLEQVMTNA